MKDFQGMTVGELKKMLEKFEDGDKVGFRYASGDYWHTVLVGSVTEGEPSVIKWSEGNSEFRLMEDYEEDEDTLRVIVLG